MFARFDENPAMTLRVIKETKRYGRTDAQTHARTDGQRENSIPTTNKVCGGYKHISNFLSNRKCIESGVNINLSISLNNTQAHIWSISMSHL